MKTILIQLIGVQSLPNLYTLVALKPDILVNVYSKRTKKQENCLNQAIKDISENLKIESIYLEDFPTTEATRAALTSYCSKVENNDNTIIINLTGGTKLMSIGAYLVAKAAGFPSVYLDTQSHKFHDGGTSKDSVIEDILKGNESTKELAATIPLDSILKAHQFSMLGSQDFHNEALLNLAWALDEEKQSQNKKPIDMSLYDDAYDLRSPKQLLYKDFDFGTKINQLCVEAKLMQWGDETSPDGIYILADSTLSNQDLKKRIQQINNFLTGSWWELLLATELEKQTALTDIHWSVDVQQGEGTPSEEDILARSHTELLCFSCKMSSYGAKLFSEIHKLTSNTRNMGGSFAKPVLAVYKFDNKSNEDDLREIAKELKIKIITRKDLDHLGNQFGKKQ